METRRHHGIHGDTWGLLYIYIYVYDTVYVMYAIVHFFVSSQHGGSFHFTFDSSENDVSQSKVPVSVGYMSVRAGTK